MLKRLVLILLMTLLFGAVMLGPVQSQATDLLSLEKPGPYEVYNTEMTFVDAKRDNWELKTTIWYPAYPAQGTPLFRGSKLLKDVPPDRTGAPYPLIIYSHGWMGSPTDMASLMGHLASYGYVVAGPSHHDYQADHAYVDRPLDILTVLDGLSNLMDGDLAGMIDANNVGLMGSDTGAETTLQMIGLMYDPIHHESWCAEHENLTTTDCFVSFQKTSDYRAQLGLEDLPDGRWQPFGDDRIHAALAIAPCTFPLITEDMLAELSTPVMFVYGAADTVCDYEGNAVRSYTGLTLEDRYLVTLLYTDHFPSPNTLLPFVPAFFGLYVQGNEDFATALTAEQAEHIHGVVWGPYAGD